MARLSQPAASAMDAEQLAVCDEVRNGPRGRVPAPMIAWLHNPELARRGQKLGELLRFETGLDPAVTEIAVLACARHWTSHHEWTAHKKLALAAGVSPQAITDVAEGREPTFGNEKHAMAHWIAATMLENGRLDQALYDAGEAMFGERGLVELTATVGYYCLVSLTLNVFELGLPENFAAELDTPGSARSGV